MKMKNGLINPAVLAFSLLEKYTEFRNLLPLLILMLLPSFALIVPMVLPHGPLSDDMQQHAARGVIGYCTSPLILLLLAFGFVSDGIAGKKLVSEADALSLLFTRPITRFSYVITKFVAGVLGSTVVLSLALVIAYATGLYFGLNKIDIGPLSFLSIILNAASWTSLFVFWHSAQPVTAILCFTALLGADGMGQMFVRAESTNNVFIELYKSICLFIHRWFGDFIPGSINLAEMLAAASFDIYEFAIVVSNIVFFLFLASWALSKRELFYGSD